MGVALIRARESEMRTKRITAARRPRREAGFSIIEVLVGFFILLLVLMGLLPLFTRAIVHNVSGKEAMVVTNFGTEQIEDLMAVSFNSWETSIPLAGNVRQTIEYWGRGDEDELGTEHWTDDPDDFVALWKKTTQVRQFTLNTAGDTNLDGVADALAGLEDADFDGYFDNELAGGTSPNIIRIKEVRVLLESQHSAFGGGAPTTLTLRTLKAF